LYAKKPKGTEMKRLSLDHVMAAFVLLSMMLVTACAAIGVPSPDTFNKRALAGYSTVEGIAKTASELRTAGKLSDADRDNVVATSRTAIAGLDLARQVHSANPQAGEDKLSATITVLAALQAYLATKGAK
jgi:hypothetical protein